jgi:hypothetical protein
MLSTITKVAQYSLEFGWTGCRHISKDLLPKNKFDRNLCEGVGLILCSVYE